MKSNALSLWAATGMLLVSAAASAQTQTPDVAECSLPEVGTSECFTPGTDSNWPGHDCVPEGVGYQQCNWNPACTTCNHGTAVSGFPGTGCPGGNCYMGTGDSYGFNGHHCQSGYCQSGYCQSGYCQSGYCGNGFCRNGHGHACLSPAAIARCMATTAYPDAGWNPPVQLPVNRDRIWYGSYYPQAFYGSPGGGFIGNYPQVYQPTDTTQLGYYYANVPTWQPRPGMIPPVPIPSHYHARIGMNASGFHHPIYSQNMGHSGFVHRAGYAPQNVWSSPGMSSPKPQIIRPQVADSGSGGRNRLRLSSLTSLFD